MARKPRAPRLGKQPPRHRFFLNPYQDVRFTTCPKCSGKTKLRKVPLVIHIDPLEMIALNKTCRYCPYGDLLIAHQDELAGIMAAMFAELKPEVIGNDYLVVGTVDRADWRQGTREQRTVQDMLERLHDFDEVLQFKLVSGWGPA